MRVLLDESVPRGLGALLVGHEVSTVQSKGWSGTKNGRLLTIASAEFDILVTADKGIEFQQNLTALPIAVLVVVAKSNRLTEISALAPSILRALAVIQPKTLTRVTR